MTVKKIEQSEHRAEIERQIAQGIPNRQVAAWCKNNGLNVSEMSIKRHIDGSPTLQQARESSRASAVADGISTSELDDIEAASDAEFIVEIPDLSKIDLKEESRQDLMESWVILNKVVKTKMKRFAEGKGRYPVNEIKGLSNLMNCLGSMSGDKDKVLSDKPSCD